MATTTSLTNQTTLSNDLNAVVASVTSAAVTSVQTALQQLPADNNDAQTLAYSLQTLTSQIENAVQSAARQMIANTPGTISNAQLTQDVNALVATVINASSTGMQNVMSQFPTGSSGAATVEHGLQIVVPAIINAASATAYGITNQTSSDASDAQAKAAEITAAVTANPDGGLTIAGTAQAGSTVQITYPDGSTGIATADRQGQYSATTHAPQTSGTVQITPADTSGHASGTATDIAYTDVTPPLAPTISTVTPHTDGGFTITGIAEAGSTVTAVYPDGSTGNTTANIQGQYSLTTSAAQLSGTLSVTATDLAGNVSAHSDSVYTAVPLVSFTAIASGVDGDLVSQANHLVFQGNLSVPLAAGEQVQIGGSGGWLTAEVHGTTWTYDDSLGTSMPDGTYTIQARVVDSAGNVVGAPISQMFVIDSTPPQAPIISNMITNADGGMTITGTAEAGSTIKVVYPDGTTTAQGMVDANGHYSITTHTPQTGGTVDVVATDPAGNSSPMVDATYTLPQTAPVVVDHAATAASSVQDIAAIPPGHTPADLLQDGTSSLGHLI
jgi:Flp pilus assembly pilin Flp